MYYAHNCTHMLAHYFTNYEYTYYSTHTHIQYNIRAASCLGHYLPLATDMVLPLGSSNLSIVSIWNMKAMEQYSMRKRGSTHTIPIHTASETYGWQSYAVANSYFMTVPLPDCVSFPGGIEIPLYACTYTTHTRGRWEGNQQRRPVTTTTCCCNKTVP